MENMGALSDEVLNTRSTVPARERTVTDTRSVDQREEMSTGAVWSLALAVVLWFFAFVFTGLFVLSVAAAESTCRTTIPPAEGLTVERVDLSWTPPIVRCTLLDHDAGQEGLVPVGVVDSGELLFIAVIDMAALGEALRRSRRRGQRRSVPGTDALAPSTARSI